MINGLSFLEKGGLKALSEKWTLGLLGDVPWTSRDIGKANDHNVL